MGAVRATINLTSLDAYVREKHGRARALSPDEIAVVQRWGELMLTFIQASWPVDTGTSRDAWTFYVDPSPGTMALIIENPMWYADYVYGKGDVTRTPIWEGILVEAWSLSRQGLLIEARARVDKTEAAIATLAPQITSLDAVARVFGRPQSVVSSAPVL